MFKNKNKTEESNKRNFSLLEFVKKNYQFVLIFLLIISIGLNAYFFYSDFKTNRETSKSNESAVKENKTDNDLKEESIKKEKNAEEKIDTLDECLNDDYCLYIPETQKIVNGTFEEGLVLSDLDGKNEVTLVGANKVDADGPDYVAVIGYSDGGKFVYYSPKQPDGLGGAFPFGGYYGGMNKINTTTKEITQIFTSANAGSILNVSRDGVYVAYETYTSNNHWYPTMDKVIADFNGLVIKNLNTGAERKVQHRPGYLNFGNVYFSPYSAKIAYEEVTEAEPDARQYDVIVEDPSNGSARVVFNNCSLSVNFKLNKTPWLDNRYLLINCSEKYYKIDTQNNYKKEEITAIDSFKDNISK